MQKHLSKTECLGFPCSLWTIQSVATLISNMRQNPWFQHGFWKHVNRSFLGWSSDDWCNKTEKCWSVHGNLVAPELIFMTLSAAILSWSSYGKEDHDNLLFFDKKFLCQLGGFLLHLKTRDDSLCIVLFPIFFFRYLLKWQYSVIVFLHLK